MIEAALRSPFAVAGFLLAVLLVFHEIGYRLGRRAKRLDDDDYKRRVDMMRNAVLALVTFLVGFSFAGAGARFIDRQDMMVKEANAIGTSYLRAMLLPEPQRSRLQAELRQYVLDRLELLSHGPANIGPLLAKAGETQMRIWQAGVEGVGTDRVFANFILPPLNDVIDIHSEHLSAARRHIPNTILIVIVAAAALGTGMIGYDNGLVRRRYFLLSCGFAAVSAASLWMTIDLDRPRQGFLRASELPYVELLESMR
jgi:hypothetical protein